MNHTQGEADYQCSLALMAPFTATRSNSGIPVFAQPAKKEYVNKGRDKRKNPGKHLRKPRSIKTIHIASLGGSAGFRGGQAAGKLGLKRYLYMGAPEPVRH